MQVRNFTHARYHRTITRSTDSVLPPSPQCLPLIGNRLRKRLDGHSAIAIVLHSDCKQFFVASGVVVTEKLFAS